MQAALDTHDPDSPYGSIHPRDKLTVARRLGWAGLTAAYSVPGLPVAGPVPTGLVRQGAAVTIAWDQPIRYVGQFKLPRQ